MNQEARDLLFGSDEWWRHLRAAVSEGRCPRCGGGLEWMPDHPAKVAGHCGPCDRTWWIGGPDEKWAEAGESVGRTNEVGGPQ